uniref:N-6 DNA methylase n=1 Tax=Neisseria gonorrhoeae TaxID=485 RepID=UPI00385156AA
PILFIDASNDFIKVGKQNVLEEKDIAKIVDTYSERVSVEGYSHIASREEIIANEYNLNIPRFVVVTSTSIPHDVDAHLL